MYMKLKDGKDKVVTLSYDDGVIFDKRLIDIMNKYGVKGTFNISSGLYYPEEKERVDSYVIMKLSESQEVYINSGQEIASHAYTHEFLCDIKHDELIAQILDDRRDIEKNYKTLARGLAYPYGSYNSNVIDALSSCGICYARTAASSHHFWFPQNWLEWTPTCHHNDPKLMELAEQFVAGPSKKAWNWMMYVWGHAYEFHANNNWDVIEKFCEYIGGRDDIWYATNIEIYDYVQAYKSLRTSVDKKIVHNPSAIDVWFFTDGKTHCVKAGETLYL